MQFREKFAAQTCNKRFDSILLQSSATHFCAGVATLCSKFSWHKNFREKTSLI